MLRYVYHALWHFRRGFSRHRSWLLFGAVVVSFLAAPEMIGVTSRCRFWRVGEADYHRLLHVFSSQSLSVIGAVGYMAALCAQPGGGRGDRRPASGGRHARPG